MLIVFSVIVTVVLLNRKPEPVHSLTTPSPPKLAVDLNAPSPVIVAPIIAPPSSVAEKTSSTTTSTDATDPLIISAKPETPAAPTPAPALVLAPAPDERIYKFIDAIRVTGINSSGNASKVIMNDRIYRVNDVVERLLGLKLIKVEAEKLTFVDENGIIYTKNF